MPIDEDTKRKIIDLYFVQHKRIREVSRIIGKSSRDVTAVLKEHKIRQAQKYTAYDKEQIKQEKDDDSQSEYDKVLPNVKAYKLFSEGKNPVEVTTELNLTASQAQQFYTEYWKLRQMHQLFTIYQEIKNSIGYFLKLFRLAKKEGLTPEQIVSLLKMADNIQDLKEEFQYLENEVKDLELRKIRSKEQLQTLRNDMATAKDELSDAQTAFKKKFGELSEICSQIRMLENYVEQLKNGQSYQEIEQTATDKVSELLSTNKKLLEYALVSVIEALRNEPDRYLLIDKMPITTTTILNYNSLAAARQPTFPQGDEQFVRERVLELADGIFDRFQKGVVDSTVSTAAGLEKGSSYSSPHQALPYYQSSSHLPRYLSQNSRD